VHAMDRASIERFERARACFASSNWPAVLEALSSDLPPTLALPCIAMRTHALEALGNVEGAVGGLTLLRRLPAHRSRKHVQSSHTGREADARKA
jgi:hypothetical protein